MVALRVAIVVFLVEMEVELRTGRQQPCDGLVRYGDFVQVT